MRRGRPPSEAQVLGLSPAAQLCPTEGPFQSRPTGGGHAHNDRRESVSLVHSSGSRESRPRVAQVVRSDLDGLSELERDYPVACGLDPLERVGDWFVVKTVMHRWIDALEREAATAIRNRELPEGTDPKDVAFAVNALAVGANCGYQLDRDPHVLERARRAMAVPLTPR